MIILLIMAIGILIGLKWFPEKWSKYNHQIQVVSIVVLIFCMGVSLGSNPSFIEDLVSLGIKGIIFAIIPIGFSVGVVFFLTKHLLAEKQVPEAEGDER